MDIQNNNRQQLESVSDSIEIISEDDIFIIPTTEIDERQKALFKKEKEQEEAESAKSSLTEEEKTSKWEKQKHVLSKNTNNTTMRPEQEVKVEDRKKEDKNGDLFPRDEKSGNNNEEVVVFCKEEESCYDGFLRVEESLNNLFRGILSEKGQLHQNMTGLQSAISEIVETKDQEIKNHKKIIESKDSEILKYKAHTKKLIEDVNIHKINLQKSEKHVEEILQNLEKHQKEHKDLLSQLEKNEFVTLDSLPLEKRKDLTTRKSSSGDGRGQQHNGDNARKFHEEDIQMMEDFKISPWQNIYATLLKDKVLGYIDLADILFFTLWEAYKFSKDTALLQQKKLLFNLHFPYSSEAAENNIGVQNMNEEIQKNLKGLMLDIEPKDLQRTFKVKLVQSMKFEDKIVQYLKREAIFDEYIENCLKLSRYFSLKAKCLHLRSHPLDKPLEREFFENIDGNGVTVERVIYPALICFQNSKIICLRKGIVRTKS